MKRTLGIVLLSIVAVGCESTGGSSSHEHHHKIAPDHKQAVMKAGDQYIAALIAKDIPALQRLWADDLIFITPRGQVQNKAQRIADIQSGTTAFKSIDLQDVQIRQYGNAVAHVSRGKLNATYGGQDSSGDYRITMLWSRHGGEWQIHGIQMTAIRE